MAGRPKRWKGVSTLTLNRHLEYNEAWKWAERIARQEGISLSHFIEKCLCDVREIKEGGNPQPELFDLIESRDTLSKTIQAKFVLQDLNMSLNKLESLKKERNPNVIQQKFQVNNIRKLLPKAESLSKFVFKEKFDAVFKRIDKNIL